MPGGGGEHRRHGHRQRGGIGDNSQAALGRQLSSRVDSGAITQDQAEKVAHERGLLEQAYGPNWRYKVFGGTQGGGYMRKTRQMASQGNVRAQGLFKALMERRKKMLARARTSLDGGTTAP